MKPVARVISLLFMMLACSCLGELSDDDSPMLEWEIPGGTESDLQCPGWSFYEDVDSIDLNLLALRTPILEGGVVQSEQVSVGDGFLVIKLKGEAGDLNNQGEGEIFVNGIIPEGYLGRWPSPVEALVIRQSYDKTWSSSMTADLFIDGWRNGLMDGYIVESSAHYADTSRVPPELKENIPLVVGLTRL